MFVHLHVHSHFSFKDATPSPLRLAQRAKELGMSALALTDHNTLAGAIRFYQACRRHDVKPIIGCEITLDTGHHLVLLAMNIKGYGNLCRLVTAMHLSNPSKKTEASLAMVEKHSMDLICLTACSQRQVITRACLINLKEIFADRLYVELENPLTQDSPRVLRQLVHLAEELELPLVATNNVHFLSPPDHRCRDILAAMGENVTALHLGSTRHPNSERYFKSATEMDSLFKEYPEAVKNCSQVAARCNLELPLGTYRFPYFPLPADKSDAFLYLQELCLDGLGQLYPKDLAPLSRLDYELSVIRELGFVEYFLVVWDIVNFARSEKIRCSGRGSAGDSLVAYVLGITAADPVDNNLIFERFLNPERRGMPDIDLDFDSARRDEVLAYVYHRYSESKVAMVGTVNTYSSRSALREVAKALSFSSSEISHLAAFMPRTAASNMEAAIEKLPELSSFPKGPRYDDLLAICAELEGVPRHLSVHLGGVVISREPLTDLVPLEWSAKGIIVTQYDKDDIEALGLVKMDLLGLRVLSAIQYAVDSLARAEVHISTSEIPLDDPKTFALLQSTHTVGVFQLESPGMRELLGRLQPTTFSDVVANIALFRPGPMQADMISPFIARRHGEEEVSYSHESLRPILGETYGVIVYQEQVLQVAAALAGFSLGQGDLLRRAMTKNCSPEELETIQTAFLAGCRERHVANEVAETVFKQLAAFAAYGFNKGHAANFGLVAYQTAYLKAHYPAHFLAGVLNNQPMGFYPSRVVLNEARLSGIAILPLDLGHSKYDFTVEGSALRVGLMCIPSFTAAHYALLEDNRTAQELQSLSDALRRLPFPEQLWQSLLQAGALDCFGARSSLANTILHSFATTKKATRGQFSLWIEEEASDYGSAPPSLKERLRGELAITGLTYTMHPLRLYEDYYRKLNITYSADLLKQTHGARLKVAGFIVARQTPPTRSKQRVIFLTIEDPTGLIDVAVFSHAQQKYAACALEATLLYIEGTVRRTGRRSVSINAEKVLDLRSVVTCDGAKTPLP
ncbi:MAG: DNA polymerase III subunit alpha [Firmicutes bacterium]|nr:DNA polymerase III subunit alpha [Dethiobacter sp.]MBS3887912.1 DNA polymerase III subunit alpha [Bacillota bacterium]MBS4054248.1 DNA polymerase III subunit alpha [Thermaerobacter sp.]